MSEQITVYNYRGEPLTTLRANVTCSWVLGGIGEATFDIAYTDPKCQQAYLEYGNLLLVEHSNLPPWVGVIDTPRAWKRSSVSVRAYDITKLWQWRNTTAGQLLKGTAGVLFNALVYIANAAGETCIRPGSIYSDGIDRQETLSDYVGKHIDTIRTRSGSDYQLRPVKDGQNRLLVYIDWVARVGVYCSAILTEGKNVESTDGVMSEEGTIVNQMVGYGDTTTAGKRLQSTKTDYASISQFGLRQGFTTFSGNTVQSTLDANTQAFLNANKTPARILKLKALDVGNTFANLSLGNTLRVNLFSIGFTNGGRGYSANVRIQGMKYVSNSQTVELIVTEV